MVLLGNIHEIDLPSEVVRQGAGYEPNYNLNRQNNVVREKREPGLWNAIAPFLNDLAPFEAEPGDETPSNATAARTQARSVIRRVFDPNRPRPLVATTSIQAPQDREVTEKKREQAVEGHKLLLSRLAA